MFISGTGDCGNLYFLGPMCAVQRLTSVFGSLWLITSLKADEEHLRIDELSPSEQVILQ